MTEGGFNQGTRPKDRFEAEFEALPLDEKFSKLFRMEVAALDEAIRYAFNSPMKVVQNVGDAIGRFGERMESEFKKTTCPPYQEPPTAADPVPPPAATQPPKTPRPPKA